MTLGEEECRRLLSTHGTGRVAISTAEGPAIFPVSYVAAADGALLAPGTRTQRRRGAFDAEHTESMEEKDHREPGTDTRGRSGRPPVGTESVVTTGKGVLVAHGGRHGTTAGIAPRISRSRAHHIGIGIGTGPGTAH
ncbi:pyridoxamine 5'-phosphate oxidase family protein [Streptomyces sp. NBC_01276]|uniref:pyridoxamine 5'-phosphate oxidase family protein n=1 Tax=Streptomyces sp. NBC_01276 TaxID=2903808 RepID=UPI00352FDDC6